MRNKLSSYRNKYVLAKGWITFCHDLDDCRRICVKQPTIRKPDKNLLFNQQEIISTEHHLNLFIPFEYLPDFDTVFENHQKISFSGIINLYTRSDGSKDYSVKCNKQSTLNFELNKLSVSLWDILDNLRNYEIKYSLDYFEKYALPKIIELEDRLENANDMLPTFTKTYKQYKNDIDIWKDNLDGAIKRLKLFTNSRRCRRMSKSKKNKFFEILPS